MDDTKKPNEWFITLACVLVVAAITGVSTFVFKQVQAGGFPWWSYPAFMLLAGFIFMVYWIISREKN